MAVGGEFKETIRAEVYDARSVQSYYKGEGTYVADGAAKAHNFDRVPIVEFESNDERKGDFEKVANLVNAYDLTLSDVQNELEEFRMAYMVFTNCTIDSATILKARETGAFNLPRDAKAEFLTKDINAELLEKHKTSLENNIYRFSKTVNMTDEKFSGGAMSGEARKWKLLSLENRAISKERKHTAGLRKMFELIEFLWKAKGGAFDYKEVTFQYTRNIPVELKEASEMAKNFKGIISNKTLFGLLPFVEDVEAEIAQLEEEMEDIDITEDPPNGQPDKEATGD